MEYKTDKRTKNLTLRDIHVGDWVQVWCELTERYSPPLKIIQICDDGTIYLVTSDEERPTPWEENIKNVDVLPITPELLNGFGFEVIEGYPPFQTKVAEGWSKFLISYNNKPIGYLEVRPDLDAQIFCRPTDGICATCVHRMFDELIKNKVLENVSFEWKGYLVSERKNLMRGY